MTRYQTPGSAAPGGSPAGADHWPISVVAPRTPRSVKNFAQTQRALMDGDNQKPSGAIEHRIHQRRRLQTLAKEVIDQPPLLVGRIREPAKRQLAQPQPKRRMAAKTQGRKKGQLTTVIFRFFCRYFSL
jgi:hypothetical protein